MADQLSLVDQIIAEVRMHGGPEYAIVLCDEIIRLRQKIGLVRGMLEAYCSRLEAEAKAANPGRHN